MQSPSPNMNVLRQVGIEYARANGFTGKNVTIAVLDSGIGPHVDFVRGGSRILAFYDCVNHRRDAYDDSGHGSHVAGLIGSNGYDYMGNLIGVAPACNFIILKVLDARGNGKVSNVMEGLRWIRAHQEEYGIQVVNISVGTPVTGIEDENSDLVKEVNRVWDSGMTVVVAAGNNGPGNMSITTPGISRKVITVGSYDDAPGSLPEPFKIPAYSGRGPTISCVCKPDLVAPGTNILSCNYARRGYTIKSGTSMSTPIVSGAIALLLEQYPTMSNMEVKMRLYNSCTNLGLPFNQQGAGMLNIKKLLTI